MKVRCETCGVLLDRDAAHDALDDQNRERWWCETCCPLCMIFTDPDAGISVTKLFSTEGQAYPEWMERDPETGEVP